MRSPKELTDVFAAQYIGEFAPTHLRGRLVGLYGACFQVGSVLVSITERLSEEYR
jgi:hypothetical protein